VRRPAPPGRPATRARVGRTREGREAPTPCRLCRARGGGSRRSDFCQSSAWSATPTPGSQRPAAALDGSCVSRRARLHGSLAWVSLAWVSLVWVKLVWVTSLVWVSLVWVRVPRVRRAWVRLVWVRTQSQRTAGRRVYAEYLPPVASMGGGMMPTSRRKPVDEAARLAAIHARIPVTDVASLDEQVASRREAAAAAAAATAERCGRVACAARSHAR